MFRYFKLEELLSPDGLKLLDEGRKLENILDPLAVAKLEEFREELNTPILINFGDLRLRGYRSPEENKYAGGAPNSFHLFGSAFDCTTPDLDFDDFKKAAFDFGWPGIGLYRRQNFIHLDWRQTIWVR